MIEFRNCADGFPSLDRVAILTSDVQISMRAACVDVALGSTRRHCIRGQHEHCDYRDDDRDQCANLIWFRTDKMTDEKIAKKITATNMNCKCETPCNMTPTQSSCSRMQIKITQVRCSKDQCAARSKSWPCDFDAATNVSSAKGLEIFPACQEF